MKDETITISAKGQIIIPAHVRKKFGLRKGDKLILEVENRSIKMIPKTVDLTKLVGSWPDLDIETMTKEIIEEREDDMERERLMEKGIKESPKKRSRR